MLLDPSPSWSREAALSAASAAQGTAEAELLFPTTDLGPLRVVAFDGLEALHEPFAFEVVFVADPASASELRARGLGEPVALRFFLGRTEEPRLVAGVVLELTVAASEHASGHASEHHGTSVLALRLGPAVSLLGHTRNSRVHCDARLDQIIRSTLERHGVGCVFSLAGQLPARPYAVQYEESDAEFVYRLLHEEGLVSFYEHFATADDARVLGHDRAGECLVIGEGEALFGPLGQRLRFRPDTGALARAGQARESDVHRLEGVARVRPGAHVLRDVDPRRTRPVAGRAVGTPAPGSDSTLDGAVLTSTAHVPARRSLEVYGHHGQYGVPDVSERAARRGLEQTRAGAIELEGDSACPRLQPGRWFSFEGETIPEASGELVLTSVRHRYRASAAEGRYRCTFRCAPKSSPLRPPMPPRRVVQAVETAMVVGAPGDELTAELTGSVKIQFPWDREGTHDDRSSAWVRVVAPWSGPGYGFQFVPRIGSEVLVAFLGGDPDRPVVVGCLSNGYSTLPFPIPQEATRSGIRTRSIPAGAGYNELSFDDAAGREEVRIRAERDLVEDVRGRQRVDVGADQSTSVGGARAVHVAGDERRSVGGSRRDEVTGADVLSVGGPRQETVGGNRSATVGGSASARVGREVALVAGRAVVVTAGAEEPSDLEVTASGLVRAAGARGIALSSRTELSLTVGKSRLRITPDSIELSTPSLVLRADDASVRTGGASLRMDDSFVLSSDKIALSGEASRLELTRGARLEGDTVALSRGGPREATSSDGPSDNPGEVVFRLRAPAGESGPFTARIALPSGDVTEVTADANGEVRLPGGPSERFVLLEVRSGDHVFHHQEAD